MQEELESALRGFFATNITRETGAKPDYGIRVLEVRNGGRDVHVEFRFLSGREYCCFEFGCHCTLYEARGWQRLRELLTAEGADPPPLKVQFHVIVEHGALGLFLRRWTGNVVSDGYAYESEFTEVT